jgi:protein-S-isoprenylcysteine O-methyltransferase Ste14
MFTEGQREEGLVREILSRGDLETKQVKEELWVKNISFVRSYDRAFSGLFLVLVILWLLPAIGRWTDWGFLSLFARLPRVDFPIGVIIIGAFLFIAAVSLEAQAASVRQKQGGCHDLHESVVIVREGPYRVIRHPGYLAELIYFPLLPIILSRWVPFTIFATIVIIVVIASCTYLIRVEDSFNQRKWGEEYRQYMEEVPAINFVKGLKAHRR